MHALIAKWNDYGDSHPLIAHMIDSGTAAGTLWRCGLTDSSRHLISEMLGLCEDQAGQAIAYWTALHDIGKATPTFQAKHEATRLKLDEQGFAFPVAAPVNKFHHSLLSAWILKGLPEFTALPPGKGRVGLLMAIAGHHGQYPAFAAINSTAYQKENLGDQHWHEVRLSLLAVLFDLFHPPEGARVPLNRQQWNVFFGILSGFIVTSDWLSSNNDFFPYTTVIDPPQDYFSLSCKHAEQAVKTSGWAGWQPDEYEQRFEDLFPFLPSPLQKRAIEQACQAKAPFMAILEAPTGSGKTEFALQVAAEAIRSGKLRGCYVAMPTQATSNQMFRRTCEFLQKRYSGVEVNTQLVHGNALLNDDFQKVQVTAVGDDEHDFSGVRAMGWFLPRKRSLLAPFGIGTVDQTFLSVLQARHFFLRIFGLHGKFIIFDEVHAYDVYMATIFKRLLGWLRAMGCSVILLSATLPESSRRELLNAYDPTADMVSTKAAFPRISINSDGQINTQALGETTSRAVKLGSVGREPADIATFLRERLAEGGCAAVICNTVERAQSVFEAISKSGYFDPSELDLFHARFPFCWRQQREEKILDGYGKLSQPLSAPRRGVVIATQVIEQSLDLDFDLLITDLAPIDLLIQRIGRLQRHSQAKNPPVRPDAIAEPECVLSLPRYEEGELAHFDAADRLIYEEAILQRTFFVLLDKPALSLPAESDQLIMDVYTDHNLPTLHQAQNEALHRLWQKMIHNEEVQMMKAKNRLIEDVNVGDLFSSQEVGLEEEDDPRVHEDLRALTRDTRPTVQLVCLVEDGQGRLTLLDGGAPFDLDIPPTGERLQSTMRSMVTISNYEVVKHFQNQPPTRAWKKTAPLRFAYPAVFKYGVCQLNENLRMVLDEQRGILIEKTHL